MALYYRKEDKTHSIYTMPSTFPASSVTFDRTAVASDYRPDASWLASGNIQNALAEVNHNICSKDICMNDVETTDQAQHNHAAGTYFIWKGSYAKATAAIAISDTIASGTGGNVEVTSISGELSEINSNLSVNYFELIPRTGFTITSQTVFKAGKICVLQFTWAGTLTNADDVIASVSSDYLPDTSAPLGAFRGICAYMKGSSFVGTGIILLTKTGEIQQGFTQNASNVDSGRATIIYTMA